VLKSYDNVGRFPLKYKNTTKYSEVLTLF